MIDPLRIILIKTLHLKMIHGCEAPRSILSKYFGKKPVLKGSFGEIWRIQIQMYPPTSVEPKQQILC